MAKAVIDDGAVPVSRQEALTGQPTQGHYIVMMARPDDTCVPDHCADADFHAMRKDASGTWSWKLSSMPATDKDLEGQPITDPEAAPLPGHYLACGYFKVEPEKMYLESRFILQDRPPLALEDMIDVLRYKDTSVQVTVSPLPCNPDRDAEDEPIVRKITAEDLAWDRQRETLKYKQWKAGLAKALELGTPVAADAGATVASPSPSPASVNGQGNVDGAADVPSFNVLIVDSSPFYRNKNLNVMTTGAGAASPATAVVRNYQPSTGRRLKAPLLRGRFLVHM